MKLFVASVVLLGMCVAICTAFPSRGGERRPQPPSPRDQSDPGSHLDNGWFPPAVKPFDWPEGRRERSVGGGDVKGGPRLQKDDKERPKPRQKDDKEIPKPRQKDDKEIPKPRQKDDKERPKPREGQTGEPQPREDQTEGPPPREDHTEGPVDRNGEPRPKKPENRKDKGPGRNKGPKP